MRKHSFKGNHDNVSVIFLQDLDEATCRQTCIDVSSCVYLQYENYICFLCINDYSDVIVEGGLSSATAQPYPALVKLGIHDVIFAQYNCHPIEMRGVISVGGSMFYETSTTSPLTRIAFCKGANDFRELVSGLRLSFGENDQREFGCEGSSYWGEIPDFVAAENEVVLAVEACFQYSVDGQYVVNTMMLATNLRRFGPFGSDLGGCVTYSHVGYGLKGFRGRAGGAINEIGALFDRC